MIDNNVNMANMAMTLSTKVKPVSPTYAKEMAEQSVRGKGLQYISGKRQLTGTMVGQSNGWDRSVNEVSEANLPGFNNNLNKDKFEIFKFRINNIEGISDSDKVKVKDVLAKHIVSPVRFAKTINTMLENGVDTFIEIGPGKTLSGFVKRTPVEKEINSLSINNVASLEEVMDFIKKEGK